MNVGVFFCLDKNSGGAYHQALKTINILSQIKEINFSFYNETSNKKKLFDKNIKHYTTNIIDKIFFLLNDSVFLKNFLKKFKIKNKFEIFVKKENIDIVFFVGNSRLSVLCNNIDYISYIYEFHHIFRPDLPEYKGWNNFEFRENLLKLNTKKSIALIVDTNKKAYDLVKYYNCIEEKINVIPLTSNIISNDIYTKNGLSKNLENIFQSKEEYYFYPAQYWSHKNHVYILEAIKFINEKTNKKIKFVFTGSKKQNFKKINDTIKKFDLEKQVIILEYLSNYEIIELYKNCNALVMPSLIGYSSLPLYEAFFFEKPVFYTKKLLDESLREFVNEIDINDVNSLANEIINFKNNKKKYEEKIKKAKIYFEKHLSDEKITNSYKKLFKKIVDSQKIYR